MLCSCTQCVILGFYLMIFILTRNSMYATYMEGFAETSLIRPEVYYYFFLFSMIFGNIKPFPCTLSLVTSICSNQNIQLLNKQL